MNHANNPIGTAFLAKAGEIMPAFLSEFAELVDSSDSASMIDEKVFAKSEFLGGMAAVIIALVVADI